jgi:amphi-Trp domain-containing protein
MADKQSVEFASNLEPHGVAAYLEALAVGLRDGRVLIESGDKTLNLEVAPTVGIELEAETSEKGKHSIEIKLEWRIEAPVVEIAPPSLLIASGSAMEHRSSDSE